MQRFELNEEESESLLRIMEATDRQNDEIGVTGQQVVEFNLREAKISLARMRGVMTTEQEFAHEAHPVTVKIRAWQTTHKAGSG